MFYLSDAAKEHLEPLLCFFYISPVTSAAWRLSFSATEQPHLHDSRSHLHKAFYEILNKYLNVTLVFVVFVSELNKFLLNFSLENLTLPAAHFCPVRSPHLAQQESKNPMNKRFSCREIIHRRMKNKASSYPRAQCVSIVLTLSK